MRTFTNEIMINCNFDSIDEKFDLFQFKTTEKYISRGSKILDLSLPAVRSIAFDDGASMFALLSKNSCKMGELNRLVGENIIVKKLSSKEIKPYIVAKLFLFALANSDFEDFLFNNLSGKLYLFKKEWIGKSRRSFKALNIDIKNGGDEAPRLICNACSFSTTKAFKSPKVLETYPRYVFSIKGTLKRTFDKDENSYIRKALNGKKAEIPFLSFASRDRDLCKVDNLLKTIKSFNDKYENLISIQLVSKEIVRKIDVERDECFFEKIKLLLGGKDIFLSNYDKNPEDEEAFIGLVHRIEDLLPFSNIIVTNEIQKKGLNIVLIHNEDVYIENDLPDPYKTFDRSTPIQCVTTEDACSKLGKKDGAIFKTIIKELQIKNEIINERKFYIDDWKTFNYTSSWIFGILVDNVSYFMNVSPDGTFKLIKKSSIFSQYKEDVYNQLESYLLSFKGEEKRIVADDKGNVNLIIDTSVIPLPSLDYIKTDSPRGKATKENDLCGLLDINVYNDGDCTKFSVGPIGKTLNKTIPSAPHIYAAKVLSGVQITTEIMETLGVQFVKYNSFTVVPYPFKYLNEYVLMCKNS